MRRAAFVLVLVAACGGRAARGPAWPQMAERGADGGESLEPRTASAIVETSSKQPEEEAKPAAEEAAAEAKPTEGDKPADPAVSAPVIAPEEVINIDDIVIEIEDD